MSSLLKITPRKEGNVVVTRLARYPKNKYSQAYKQVHTEMEEVNSKKSELKKI